MSTSADFCRLSIYYCPLQPTSAECCRLPVHYCRLLSTLAEFCRLPSTCADQEPFHALHRRSMVLYVQKHEMRVNAKRLPPLSFFKSWGRPREKSRAYSI